MARQFDIACDLDVFTVDERGEHIETVAAWRGAITERFELEDGFRFALKPREGLIETVGRFIEKERRCCPFFDFELRVPAEGPILLSIRGPAGAKELLRGESGTPAL